MYLAILHLQNVIFSENINDVYVFKNLNIESYIILSLIQSSVLSEHESFTLFGVVLS